MALTETRRNTLGAAADPEALERLHLCLQRSRDQLQAIASRARSHAAKVVAECAEHVARAELRLRECQGRQRMAEADSEHAEASVAEARAEVAHWASEPHYEYDSDGESQETGAAEYLESAREQLADAQDQLSEARHELATARNECAHADAELAKATSNHAMARSAAEAVEVEADRLNQQASEAIPAGLHFLREKSGLLRQAQAVHVGDFLSNPPTKATAAGGCEIRSEAASQVCTSIPDTGPEIALPPLPQGFRWVSLNQIAMEKELAGIKDPSDFSKVSYEVLRAGMQRFGRSLLPELGARPGRSPWDWLAELEQRDRDEHLPADQGWRAAFEALLGSGEAIYLSRGLKEDRFNVVNGRHRLWLARNLGWSAIPARVRDLHPNPAAAPTGPLLSMASKASLVSGSLADALEQAGLTHEARPTAQHIRVLRESLRKSGDFQVTSVLQDLQTASPVLNAEWISSVTEEFVSQIPRKTIQSLPRLRVCVTKLDSNVLGDYLPGGKLNLSDALDAETARVVLFHELAHWLHLGGPQKFRDAVRQHFESRTQHEAIVELPGYPGVQGKVDQWFDPYAGTIYPFEEQPVGLEVVSKHLETLALPDDQLARLWNEPSFHETMLVALEIFFL